MTRADSLLDRIADHKREEIDAARRALPLPELRARLEEAGPTRSFGAALRRPGTVTLIAEAKKASPVKGVLREDFDPAALGESYARAGASALSVLTDRRFFQGAPEYLRLAREASGLPVLRKDFILDPYQVYESRLLQADCILLIASLLSRGEMADLLGLAGDLGMDVLVEVHSEAELAEVPAAARLIGVNNRDLKAFTVDLARTEELAPLAREGRPDRIVVSESGIHTREDVLRVRRAGAEAILVGEALMREPDVAPKVRELLGL